jgi:hypothetical protein
MGLTLGQVTRFLRDYPSYNILLDDVQFSEEDINQAMYFAIQKYNAMTPVTNFTSENFPNDYVLLLGTCCFLMHSEAFLQVRNQLTYSDGDVQPIGVDDKMALYLRLKDDLNAEWTAVARAMKTQRNMEQGYGSLRSGYAYIRTGLK